MDDDQHNGQKVFFWGWNINLLNKWECELLTSKNALESALPIGALLLVLELTFGETRAAINKNLSMNFYFI